MQGVVRHPVRFDVAPHVVVRPFQEWTDFCQTICIVPGFAFKRVPRSRLLTPKARDPTFHSSERPLQRLNLADMTALLPLSDALVKRVWTILFDPCLDRGRIRKIGSDRNGIFIADSLE